MVSIAINGNLGDRIGIPYLDNERKVLAHSQGYVSLFYDDFVFSPTKIGFKLTEKLDHVRRFQVMLNFPE